MVTIDVKSSETLYQMYLAFEDRGMVRDYSSDLGELRVVVNGEEFGFEVDRITLKEEAKDSAWVEDSYRVAEGYWRQ
jgi:hypothetical protein